MRRCDLQETLQGIAEHIVDVGCQGIEGIAESTLTNKFQGSAPHPVEDVNLCEFVSNL